jgi:hypothetical protein
VQGEQRLDFGNPVGRSRNHDKLDEASLGESSHGINQHRDAGERA